MNVDNDNLDGPNQDNAASHKIADGQEGMGNYYEYSEKFLRNVDATNTHTQASLNTEEITSKLLIVQSSKTVVFLAAKMIKASIYGCCRKHRYSVLGYS